jgi:acyl carrier protein
METTLTRLSQVFQDVFEDDSIRLSPSTCADDIPAWNSLMHVTLMLAVERQFGLKFSTAHLALLTDVGELVELIDGMSQPSPHP